MIINKEDFTAAFKTKLFDVHGVAPKDAKSWQVHDTLASVIMEKMANNINESSRKHLQARRACYFSAEFLVGRAVYNNLLCIGLTDTVNQALKDCGSELSVLEDIEDAALGNGGLGRLAACFLDSAATLDLPLDGYGIRYRYGLFKQTIENGYQVEQADDWAKFGDPWSRRKDADTVTVHFGDGDVLAVPYDMPIFGYETSNVGNLRLWQAEPCVPFDFATFNQQQYDKSVSQKNRAEDISRVLYPNDDTQAGKILRLKQQYFFSCASITDIIKKYVAMHGTDFKNLPKAITIQLNDTHPVVAVPELIRQLITDYGVSFNKAASIANETFNYTNHTIMAEALEKWWLPLFKKVLPDVAAIIKKIDLKLVKDMKALGKTDAEIAKLRIIDDKMIHMARLAIYMSTYVNGVAAIHTEILKNTALKEWYEIYPQRFQNKTNGVTQRRWLALCNPELTNFIEKEIGTNAFVKDLREIKKLAPLVNSETACEFMQIKQTKKQQLANVLANQNIQIDPNSIFDIQIKRLHEYKRQLLNAFSILHLYYEIKEGRIKNFYPTTFLFGAKSAPGYARAKGIIKFINEVGELINRDNEVNKFLKVVFVPNYNVSMAEKLVAAADVSIQISTAGTEASGTGNMKLMLNGAVTLGTLDGANVEIVEEAGIQNNYIFGAKVEDLEKIMPNYKPETIYKSNKALKRVVDTLIDGTFSDGGSGIFEDLYGALLKGTSWQRSDYYYLLGDFDSFIDARLKVNADYKNKEDFAKKCLYNVANAAKFSSDRTIRHYAEEIWHISPVK